MIRRFGALLAMLVLVALLLLLVWRVIGHHDSEPDGDDSPAMVQIAHAAAALSA